MTKQASGFHGSLISKAAVNLAARTKHIGEFKERCRRRRFSCQILKAKNSTYTVQADHD
jgi:hypothetical protein